MEQLKIFENEEFGQVRTVMRDGEVWFVGKDVAEALGYGKGKSLANILEIIARKCMRGGDAGGDDGKRQEKGVPAKIPGM